MQDKEALFRRSRPYWEYPRGLVAGRNPSAETKYSQWCTVTRQGHRSFRPETSTTWIRALPPRDPLTHRCWRSWVRMPSSTRSRVRQAGRWSRRKRKSAGVGRVPRGAWWGLRPDSCAHRRSPAWPSGELQQRRTGRKVRLRIPEAEPGRFARLASPGWNGRSSGSGVAANWRIRRTHPARCSLETGGRVTAPSERTRPSSRVGRGVPPVARTCPPPPDKSHQRGSEAAPKRYSADADRNSAPPSDTERTYRPKTGLQQRAKWTLHQYYKIGLQTSLLDKKQENTTVVRNMIFFQRKSVKWDWLRIVKFSSTNQNQFN